MHLFAIGAALLGFELFRAMGLVSPIRLRLEQPHRNRSWGFSCAVNHRHRCTLKI